MTPVWLMLNAAGNFGDWLTTTLFIREDKQAGREATREGNPLVESLFVSDGEIEVWKGSAKLFTLKLATFLLLASTVAVEDWSKEKGGLTERFITAGPLDQRTGNAVMGSILLFITAWNAIHLEATPDLV